MARRLPPLNALRAFEAAARHLSFTKAAGELSVTPAAVSHQVKALEDYFGIQLFRRLTRALLLTDAGQTALPALRDGFDKLAEASERLRAHDARGMLTVSVSPSFAAKWLVPRLDDFRTVHPDIDLRLDASDTIVDLARGEADLSIRYGPGGYRDLRVDLLFEAEVFPVCAPGLCDGQHPLREPADLHRHTGTRCCTSTGRCRRRPGRAGACGCSRPARRASTRRAGRVSRRRAWRSSRRSTATASR